MDKDFYIQFMWGALTMASAVAGLFFLRFWRKTRDRLFLIFAAAFWILGTNWLVLAITRHDEAHWYSLRLIAFILIIVGIVDKNRSRRRPPRAQD